MSRILLVDDDPILRSALQRLLVRRGHQVFGVGSVRQALKAFEGGAFDLVITDVYMPDEDGIDLLRQIRASDTEIPVIAFSGQFSSEFGGTLATVLASLGAKTMAKGSDLAKVLAAVNDALAKPSAE